MNYEIQYRDNTRKQWFVWSHYKHLRLARRHTTHLRRDEHIKFRIVRVTRKVVEG